MILEDKSLIENIKKNAKESLIASLLLIIFAVVLLINPENFISITINAFGYIAIFFGVLYLVFYFKQPKEKQIYSKNFETGLLLIVFGIISFIETNIIKEMLTILIGGYLIFRNVNKAGTSMILKNYTNKMWIIMLAFSLINIVLGFLIVINPFINMITINVLIATLIIISEVLMTIENIMIIFGLKKKDKIIEE